MKSDTANLMIVALIFLAAMVWCAFLLIWSTECAAIGGAYIIPQSGFPVCVQGAK